MINPTAFEIPGHVMLAEGAGGMPKLLIETTASSAEIYFHGAHVTAFRKKHEVPLLFLSSASDFASGKAIRGGVPLIFPWFGPREGLASNGTARTAMWQPEGSELLPDGAIRMRFSLPTDLASKVTFTVTVSDVLGMELEVTNISPEDFTFETCLHTYFQIGDVENVSITGLEGTGYLDKVSGMSVAGESDSIRISSEVDRIYADTTAPVEIIDPGLARTIRIEKSGSASTVVWNPWIEKSKRMADLGDDEYQRMVCVESGNVGDNRITLSPGESTALTTTIHSRAIS